LRALGVSGAVRSPTYSLIEPYEVAGRRLLHADLYRLGDPHELFALGLEDDPPDRVWWWVEWPQRGGGVLPAPDAVIRLDRHGLPRRAFIEVQRPALALPPA
jgi:tRNA threonylcarbamoyladenosine biosynthesis protein TsaE